MKSTSHPALQCLPEVDFTPIHHSLLTSLIMRRIAYFITPHGFGHASRACAVMTALFEQDRSLSFEIFTQVPIWFIRFSLVAADGTPVPFRYHDVLTDIGFVQHTSMDENVLATIERLNTFLPFEPALIDALAGVVKKTGCEAVFCDIAPLGIAVADVAGVPSVLTENFTWPWIYGAYSDEYPGLRPHIAYLQALVESVDIHMQTQPVGAPLTEADLTVRPVSRAPRSGKAQVREKIGIPMDMQAVMVTMGGVVWEYTYLDRLATLAPIHLVIPGTDPTQAVPKNVHLLAHDADIFHPDLVGSCDAVVGKVGYSTFAEVYAAGIPFGYIPRARFPESAVIERYIDQKMGGFAFDIADFQSGNWMQHIPALLDEPRYERSEPNGRDEIARFWQTQRKTVLA